MNIAIQYLKTDILDLTVNTQEKTEDVDKIAQDVQKFKDLLKSLKTKQQQIVPFFINKLTQSAFDIIFSFLKEGQILKIRLVSRRFNLRVNGYLTKIIDNKQHILLEQQVLETQITKEILALQKEEEQQTKLWNDLILTYQQNFKKILCLNQKNLHLTTSIGEGVNILRKLLKLDIQKVSTDKKDFPKQQEEWYKLIKDKQQLEKINVLQLDEKDLQFLKVVAEYKVVNDITQPYRIICDFVLQMDKIASHKHYGQHQRLKKVIDGNTQISKLIRILNKIRKK